MPLGKVGYYHDAETKTCYSRARVYQPKHSRWASKAPLRFTDEEYANVY